MLPVPIPRIQIHADDTFALEIVRNFHRSYVRDPGNNTFFALFTASWDVNEELISQAPIKFLRVHPDQPIRNSALLALHVNVILGQESESAAVSLSPLIISKLLLKDEWLTRCASLTCVIVDNVLINNTHILPSSPPLLPKLLLFRFCLV